MINVIKVDKSIAVNLLAKFPEAYRPKLALYTTEELYYVYRIMTYKAQPGKELRAKDIFVLSLKAKMYRYLRGQDKHPIYPRAFEKIGSMFRYGFEELISDQVVA